MIHQGCAKINNELLKSYNPNKSNTWFIGECVNNLYGILGYKVSHLKCLIVLLLKSLI